MNAEGIMSNPKWLQRKCPFCYEKLGKMEVLKRKTKKVCKCKKCNKIIDERFVIY